MSFNFRSPVKPRTALVIAVAVAIIFDLVTVGMKGIRLAPDSISYLNWSRILRDLHWNYIEFLQVMNPTHTPLSRLSYLSLVGLSESLFGAHWSIAMVGLNLICSASLYTLVCSCLKRCGISGAGFLLTGVFFVLAFDFRQWLYFPLTEVIFALVAFATIVLLAAALSAGKTSMLYGASFICALLAYTIRPSGPPLLLSIFLVLIFGRVFMVSSQQTRHKLLVIAPLTVLALCSIGLVAVAIFMFNIAGETDIRPDLNFIRNYFVTGVVIHDRPSTYLPPTTIWDFVMLCFIRAAYFLNPMTPGHSLAHQVLSFLFLTPMYVLSLLALLQSRQYLARGEIYKILLVHATFTVLVVFTAFHAATLIDYDLRYRVPLYPFLMVSSVIGFDNLIGRRGS